MAVYNTDKTSTRGAAVVLKMTLAECLILSFGLSMSIFSMSIRESQYGTQDGLSRVYTSADMWILSIG